MTRGLVLLLSLSLVLTVTAPTWAKEEKADGALPQTWTAFAVVMGNISPMRAAL